MYFLILLSFNGWKWEKNISQFESLEGDNNNPKKGTQLIIRIEMPFSIESTCSQICDVLDSIQGIRNIGYTNCSSIQIKACLLSLISMIGQ